MQGEATTIHPESFIWNNMPFHRHLAFSSRLLSFVVRIFSLDERCGVDAVVCHCGSVTGSSWCPGLRVEIIVSVSASLLNQLPPDVPRGGGVSFAKAPVGVT